MKYIINFIALIWIVRVSIVYAQLTRYRVGLTPSLVQGIRVFGHSFLTEFFLTEEVPTLTIESHISDIQIFTLESFTSKECGVVFIANPDAKTKGIGEREVLLMSCSGESCKSIKEMIFYEDSIKGVEDFSFYHGKKIRLQLTCTTTSGLRHDPMDALKFDFRVNAPNPVHFEKDYMKGNFFKILDIQRPLGYKEKFMPALERDSLRTIFSSQTMQHPVSGKMVVGPMLIDIREYIGELKTYFSSPSFFSPSHSEVESTNIFEGFMLQPHPFTMLPGKDEEELTEWVLDKPVIPTLLKVKVSNPYDSYVCRAIATETHDSPGVNGREKLTLYLLKCNQYNCGSVSNLELYSDRLGGITNLNLLNGKIMRLIITCHEKTPSGEILLDRRYYKLKIKAEESLALLKFNEREFPKNTESSVRIVTFTPRYIVTKLPNQIIKTQGYFSREISDIDPVLMATVKSFQFDPQENLRDTFAHDIVLEIPKTDPNNEKEAVPHNTEVHDSTTIVIVSQCSGVTKSDCDTNKSMTPKHLSDSENSLSKEKESSATKLIVPFLGVFLLFFHLI